MTESQTNKFGPASTKELSKTVQTIAVPVAILPPLSSWTNKLQVQICNKILGEK